MGEPGAAGTIGDHTTGTNWNARNLQRSDVLGRRACALFHDLPHILGLLLRDRRGRSDPHGGIPGSAAAAPTLVSANAD